MKKLIAHIASIILASILSVSYAELPKNIIEDFSDYRLDCRNQWGNKYFTDGEVYTDNGELHIIYNPYSKGIKTDCGFRAALANEGISKLATTIRIEEIHQVSGGGDIYGSTFGRISLNPFGAIANPIGNLGQVYINIRLGYSEISAETETSFRAYWTIWIEGADMDATPDLPQYTDAYPHLQQWSSGLFSTIPEIGVDYPTSLEYDEINNKFHFGFNGETISIDAPAKQEPAEWNRFKFTVRASFEDYSDAVNLQEFTYAPTTEVPTHVVFGDVYADNLLYDDFSNTLSLSKWQRPERKRLNQNGAHKFSVKSANADLHRVRFKIPEQHLDTNLLGAKVRLESSTAPIGRLRLGGQLFNVLYNNPADYNGQEGNVFGYAELRHEGGNYFARVWMGQSLNTDFTSALSYIDGAHFAMSIDPARFYELSVEVNNNGDTTFKIVDDTGLEETQTWFNDGVGVPVTPVPIFPSSDPYKTIELRAQDGAGEVVGYVDDVYIEADDSLCFPIKSSNEKVAIICL